MFDGHSASLIDLTDGNTIATVDGDERFEFGFPGIAVGMYTLVLKRQSRLQQTTNFGTSNFQQK